MNPTTDPQAAPRAAAVPDVSREFLETVIAADPRLQDAVRLLTTVNRIGPGQWAKALEATAEEATFARQEQCYEPFYGCGGFFPFTVGGTPYRLWLIKGIINHPEFGECLGLCCYTRNEILVSDATPMSKRRMTFFHEFAHAACDELRFGVQSFDEESLAELMGIALANLDAPTLAAIELYLAGAMPRAA